jgi:HEAT repeat protein
MERIIDTPKRRWLLLLILFVPALGCGRARTADDWLRQLKDPDVVLRRQACRELGNMPAEAARATPALIEALRDENGHVRHDAAAALGKLGPAAHEAVPVLVAALGDKEKSTRAAVAAALKKIDAEAAARAGVR